LASDAAFVVPAGPHVAWRTTTLGDGRFRFTMTVRHAVLGELFAHDGVFYSAGD